MYSDISPLADTTLYLIIIIIRVLFMQHQQHNNARERQTDRYRIGAGNVSIDRTHRIRLYMCLSVCNFSPSFWLLLAIIIYVFPCTLGEVRVKPPRLIYRRGVRDAINAWARIYMGILDNDTLRHIAAKVKKSRERESKRSIAREGDIRYWKISRYWISTGNLVFYFITIQFYYFGLCVISVERGSMVRCYALLMEL